MNYCAVCVTNEKSELKPAVTMIDGTVFCLSHAKEYSLNKAQLSAQYKETMAAIQSELDSQP